MLSAVPLTYFPELAQPSMSALDSYLKSKREMDAYRGRKDAAADALAQDWLKYTRLGFGLLPNAAGKARAAELSDLMHAATLAGIDPSSTDPETTAKPGYEACAVATRPCRRRGALSSTGCATPMSTSSVSSTS